MNCIKFGFVESNRDCLRGCTACVVDGTAFVHLLHPGTSRTFEEFIDKVFLRTVKDRLQNFERLDIIFDRYLNDSLKSDSRSKRCTMLVKPTTPFSKMYNRFSLDDDNKTQLFHLLAKAISRFETGQKILVGSAEDRVACSARTFNSESVAPRNHEEDFCCM